MNLEDERLLLKEVKKEIDEYSDFEDKRRNVIRKLNNVKKQVSSSSVEHYIDEIIGEFENMDALRDEAEEFLEKAKKEM